MFILQNDNDISYMSFTVGISLLIYLLFYNILEEFNQQAHRLQDH